MKKPYKIIEILKQIEGGKSIYDTSEAKWIKSFSYQHPNLIHLAYSDDTSESAPYFTATLTGAGKHYLKQLEEDHRGEIYRVSATV